MTRWISCSSGRRASLLARVFFQCMRIIPKRALRRVLFVVIHFVFLLKPRFERVARQNLTLALPEYCQKQQSLVIHEMKQTLARSLTELLRGDCLDPNWVQGNINIEKYDEFIRHLQETPTGRILVSGHFSNFEGCAQSLAVAGYPLSSIARPMKNRTIERVIHWYRSFHGNRVITRRGAYREAIRTLLANEDVGVLFDQNVTRQNAVFSPLFGMPAATTKLPALLAWKTRASIIFIRIVPDDTGYEIFWKNISETLTEADYSLSRDEFVLKVTARMNKELERVIRELPGQWFWMHRRWKTQPNDDLETVYD